MGKVAAVLVLLLWSSPVQADAVWGFSPGVKLGWVPGDGFLLGVEVSVIRLPDLASDPDQSVLDNIMDNVGEFITETYGVVFNYDYDFDGTHKLRLGGEWVGPFIGLEAGPSLVVNSTGTHVGMGFTPWIGYSVFPYYTWTWLLGDEPNIHELGVYLKTPLLGLGGGDGFDLGDGDSDWD
jgi:hypothetical protein